MHIVQTINNRNNLFLLSSCQSLLLSIDSERVKECIGFETMTTSNDVYIKICKHKLLDFLFFFYEFPQMLFRIVE